MIDRQNSPTAVYDWLDSKIKELDIKVKEENEKQKTNTPQVFEWLYVSIMGFAIITLIVATVLIWTYVPATHPIFGTELDPRILLMVPLVTYAVASFRVIDITEVAGVDFFGTPVHQFDSGLQWIPLGLLRLSRESSVFVQAEFPGDADKIQWGDEETVLESGKVRPLFVLAAENPLGTLPTEKQMTIGVSFLSKIQLVKSKYFDLVRNISPIDDYAGMQMLETNTGGIKVTPRLLEVLRHLRDTGSAFINQVVAQLSYNELTLHLEQVNQLLSLRLQLEIIPWGVELVETKFTTINPGHTFNKTIQLRGTAVAQRDQVMIAAEGERKRLILEGEGKAEAEKAILKARATGEQARLTAVAKGYKKIRTETGLSPENIAATEVGKAMATGTNNTIVTDGGISGLTGAVLAGVKASKDAANGKE